MAKTLQRNCGFSKQLDEVSKRWPGCLRSVAAVVLSIQEAQKFTLGQKSQCSSHTQYQLYWNKKGTTGFPHPNSYNASPF